MSSNHKRLRLDQQIELINLWVSLTEISEQIKSLLKRKQPLTKDAIFLVNKLHEKVEHITGELENKT